ncbi:ribbon-helix-helix protein, CopG family [Bradyrhizobium diazoefficiens]|uniref:ribbon-helix-helix protein, CopG family n=1 Tax=Bradyrhizobium diazoefficiens TaxID=1355477 RepID=UPI0004B41586|nr:ribbon-helix-helix protein, CopG family [Bradyrhizobium diazoefficiens]
MMKKQIAKKRVAVRLEEELEEAIRAAAGKERRTVSQFVRNVLADAVAKKPAHATGVAA